MGAGIVVRAAGTHLPSEHFADHFPMSSPALRTFTTAFIDGQGAMLHDPLAVIQHRSNGRFAQFATVDTSVGADRAFVITMLALTPRELAAMPSTARDHRGTPTLLTDFHQGWAWEAYNCHLVDFQVWSRARLYDGTWPNV